VRGNGERNADHCNGSIQWFAGPTVSSWYLPSVISLILVFAYGRKNQHKEALVFPEWDHRLSTLSPSGATAFGLVAHSSPTLN
jgi:hypothetical protein